MGKQRFSAIVADTVYENAKEEKKNSMTPIIISSLSSNRLKRKFLQSSYHVKLFSNLQKDQVKIIQRLERSFNFIIQDSRMQQHISGTTQHKTALAIAEKKQPTSGQFGNCSCTRTRQQYTQKFKFGETVWQNTLNSVSGYNKTELRT